MADATATKPYGDVAYADPGYQEDGKKRYPIDSEAHVKAAWSYINQGDNAAQYSVEELANIKGRITAAAKKFGVQISEGRSEMEVQDHTRALPFEMVSHNDGQTLEGYAAVFDTPARIKDWAGEYEERFSRNAFDQSLRGKPPALLFEHGMHPLLGKMPLGVLERIQSDSKGLHIRARLSDNWLIQPVRDAVRDGAITGMSVRFRTPKGGDIWAQQGKTMMRTVTNATLIDLGPTISPAYEATTASVRSILDRLPTLTGRSDAGSADGGDSSDAEPGKGEASSRPSAAMQARDRALRIQGII